MNFRRILRSFHVEKQNISTEILNNRNTGNVGSISKNVEKREQYEVFCGFNGRNQNTSIFLFSGSIGIIRVQV